MQARVFTMVEKKIPQTQVKKILRNKKFM